MAEALPSGPVISSRFDKKINTTNHIGKDSRNSKISAESALNYPGTLRWLSKGHGVE